MAEIRFSRFDFSRSGCICPGAWRSKKRPTHESFISFEKSEGCMAKVFVGHEPARLRETDCRDRGHHYQQPIRQTMRLKPIRTAVVHPVDEEKADIVQNAICLAHILGWNVQRSRSYRQSRQCRRRSNPPSTQRSCAKWRTEGRSRVGYSTVRWPLTMRRRGSRNRQEYRFSRWRPSGHPPRPRSRFRQYAGEAVRILGRCPDSGNRAQGMGTDCVDQLSR